MVQHFSLNEKYFLCLGEFVHYFSYAEYGFHFCLRNYCHSILKQPNDTHFTNVVLQSMIGEMNIKTICDNLKRVSKEVEDQKTNNYINDIIKQFSEIQSVRDLLAHKPANYTETVNGDVLIQITNFVTANRADKVEKILLHASTLKNMSVDLSTMTHRMYVSLGLHKNGADPKIPITDPQEVLNCAWLYKPSQLKRMKALKKQNPQ
ncbi:MAG: hypothetical protein EOM26_05645 [Alphaproteobacteria bacterium]|nr:hypothetical protein [Alphaproteobacteria bacterium]